MKNLKQILTEKLNLNHLEPEMRDEIAEKLINLSVQKALDEIVDEFSDEQLAEIDFLGDDPKNIPAFIESYPEKFEKFEPIFNKHLNQTINEYENRINQTNTG